MEKEKKNEISKLAIALQMDKSAAVKNLIDKFFEYDIVVSQLDDALEDVLRAGWEDPKGNWQEPDWKLSVAKSLANARHHLQELHGIYTALS